MIFKNIRAAWLMALMAALAIFLIACSPQTEGSAVSEPAAEAEVMEEEMMEEESMDEEMMDDSESMAEESHDDMAMDDSDEAMMDDSDGEMMAEESHDDMAMDDSDEAMMDDSDGEMMAEESHDDMAMDDSDEAMMDDSDGEMMADEGGDAMMAELAAWQTIALTDAATGESYTLADFKGKTVYVEPMATWCTNCRRQLSNVQAAINQLGEQEDVVFIALSLETNLRASELAGYAQNEGFTMIFSVMSEEILTAMVDDFGRSVANAPSTPHFVIRPDGTYTELLTGFESPDEVIEFINANRS